jgi:GTP-binding protein
MAEPRADERALEALREAGRLLFAGPCDFVAGSTRVDNIPVSSLPEIAFAGRSNVGKSSLINALTGRKTLARVSNTPGRTQQINFFTLGERLMLADLPGYGYAKASKGVVATWTRLIEDYLRGRRQLKRVCLLIDARHGLKDPDRRAMELMDQSAVVYQVVLTKADKAKRELDQITRDTATEIATHTAAYPEIIATSAETGAGIDMLRGELAALARPR